MAGTQSLLRSNLNSKLLALMSGHLRGGLFFLRNSFRPLDLGMDSSPQALSSLGLLVPLFVPELSPRYALMLQQNVANLKFPENIGLDARAERGHFSNFPLVKSSDRSNSKFCLHLSPGNYKDGNMRK